MPRRETAFLMLASVFIAALVVCNLIASKFIALQLPIRERPFVVSVGILPYPVTFLCTDVLSEVYGRRRANAVVLAGFVASLFVLGVVMLGGDTDTNAAIAGGLLGVRDGVEAIPARWRSILQFGPDFEAAVDQILGD